MAPRSFYNPSTNPTLLLCRVICIWGATGRGGFRDRLPMLPDILELSVDQIFQWLQMGFG